MVLIPVKVLAQACGAACVVNELPDTCKGSSYSLCSFINEDKPHR